MWHDGLVKTGLLFEQGFSQRAHLLAVKLLGVVLDDEAVEVLEDSQQVLLNVEQRLVW